MSADNPLIAFLRRIKAPAKGQLLENDAVSLLAIFFFLRYQDLYIETPHRIAEKAVFHGEPGPEQAKLLQAEATRDASRGVDHAQKGDLRMRDYDGTDLVQRICGEEKKSALAASSASR